MRQYVDERISEGNYNTTREFPRALIREDQKRRAEERLQTMLLRGLESPSSEWTKDDVNHIKNAVCERLAAKQKHTQEF